jgi:ankyrin repeat protein
VRALLAHGANPNARQRNGTAGKRYSGIGLDKNTIGASPYLLATRSGQLDIMRALKASGADVNLGLADGTTPVMAAAVRQGRLGRGIPENRIVQTIQLAIELGSDIKGASRDGDTALHVAAKRRLDTVIEFLIDHGAPVNARNGKGQTPLAVALAPVPPAKGAGQQTFDEYTFLSSHAAATAALLRKLGATE